MHSSNTKTGYVHTGYDDEIHVVVLIVVCTPEAREHSVEALIGSGQCYMRLLNMEMEGGGGIRDDVRHIIFIWGFGGRISAAVVVEEFIEVVWLPIGVALHI